MKRIKLFFAHVVFYFKITLLHVKLFQFSFVTIFQLEVLASEQFECEMVLFETPVN